MEFGKPVTLQTKNAAGDIDNAAWNGGIRDNLEGQPEVNEDSLPRQAGIAS
jgi:hypothetical protein